MTVFFGRTGAVVVWVISAVTMCLCTVGDIKKCGSVYLTVSSLEDTHLELNWNTNCNSSQDMLPDKIALLEKNPAERNEITPPRVIVDARHHPDGYYRTGIKFGFPLLPGNWEYSENMTTPDPGRHCFPYWVASIKDDRIVHSQCLAIYPTWMTDHSSELRGKNLASLFIPGTHNSATFNTPKFIQNYVMNQDRSVFTQLVFGIRYLDLRVGYYKTQGFSINHDVARVAQLEPVLQQIRKFAELAPREVIIVDFHRFPYPAKFTDTMHRDLVGIIESELGHLAYPSDWTAGGPMLEEIWRSNRNVIVCYGKREVSDDHRWLWSPITQHWGNVQKASNLKGFLDGSIRLRKHTLNPMWALMAQLTPRTVDVVLQINSLRKLADRVNTELTKWFRDEWLHEVNIVATDFFLGNDLINVAIETNVT